MIEYLTLRDVAQLLACHVNTVKRIPPDELPYWRLGHRGDRRYHVDDVQVYIAKRRVTP